MLDLPNWFWNAFAITVFIVINIALWFHFRWYKAKGIKPKPAFGALKKHEKRITKWSDIFVIAIILLMTFGYVSILPVMNDDAAPPADPETIQIQRSILYILLLQYSFWAVFMASLLSFFQKNLSRTKRTVLLAMSCIPITFGVLYGLADKDHSGLWHLKLLSVATACLLLINGPAVFLGKPFVELFPQLLRKIPLPWFRMPVEDETDKE